MRDESRSFIQKLIRAGHVGVNEKIVKKGSFRLKEKSKIKVDVKKHTGVETNIKAVSIPLDILYQDKDLIVVNKESGICVHPSKGNWDNTLINGLLFKFKSLSKVGTPNKFGLIHRIDKDTSGLVLIALNNKALWYFSRQFEEREVKKEYIAVVTGDAGKIFGKESFGVSNYIGRHPIKRKKLAVVKKERGRLATTYFNFLSVMEATNQKKISLVLAKPVTGRTHQIRVHLAHLSLPILGDAVYGNMKYKRLMLHAYKIKLKMLDGNERTFVAPVPRVFCELFNIKNLLHEEFISG